MANAKDIFAKNGSRVHQLLFDVSKGKIGGNALGMPVVKLVTTGRKTGKKRETMLTAPVVDGEQVILVASYGGDDRHPAWYGNLVADPNVVITMNGSTRNMVARVAQGGERAELWTQITTDHSNYAGYQEKTDREIPVVILEPAG